jgi:pimeloyl-ACP methyl ester carboxylesterase
VGDFEGRAGFDPSADAHHSWRSRFVQLEHSVESFNLISNAELSVIPDAGHFTLSSEPKKVIPVVKHFLEKPEKRIPVATARTGYHPGKTR